MLRTCNNTDGNKLVIFSGIARDNYILLQLSFCTHFFSDETECLGMLHLLLPSNFELKALEVG